MWKVVFARFVVTVIALSFETIFALLVLKLLSGVGKDLLELYLILIVGLPTIGIWIFLDHQLEKRFIYRA